MATDSPDVNRCFICGYDNPHALEEHHLVPRRFGGTDIPENIAHLCASCHQAIEKLYDDKFYQRLGIDVEDGELPGVDLDIEGGQVKPEHAQNREFTPASDHVQTSNRVDGPLHCGYCYTVFERGKEPNMARHLQIKHGIEDPYEVDIPDGLFSGVGGRGGE